MTLNGNISFATGKHYVARKLLCLSNPLMSVTVLDVNSSAGTDAKSIVNCQVLLCGLLK